MKQVKLKNVFSELINGEWGSEAQEVLAGVSVLRTTNFTNEGKIDYSEVVKRVIDPFKVQKKKLRPGDIILEKSGGSDHQPVGRVVFFNDPGEYLCNNFTMVLRVNQKTFSPRYIFYYMYGLHQKGITQKFQNKTTGIRNLQVKAYLELPFRFAIPTITEQKRIAGILDKVQSLIALQKQQLEKLDLLIKSKFIDMFGDPITNPKNWPIRRMGDVFKITSGGTPSTQEDSYWSGGTISWIGSNLCQNVILNKNDGQFITENGLNNSSAKILPVGTVLIALVGATIGKTALLNFSTTTNQNVAAVWVSKNKSYDSLFIFYFIQGLYDLFMRIGSGKFKMANLQFINNLPIFNVSVSLQTQFANFVKSVEQQKEVFTTRLSHLETLYKSLMQEYFG